MNEWQATFEGREDLSKTSQLKSQLSVRIFGPYEGDCSYILKSVGERLQDEEGYDACTCLDAPTVQKLSRKYDDEVYNWEASLECIDEAMVGVFVFMKGKDRRHHDYGPFENISQYDSRVSNIQELNSSVLLEFSEWLNNSPRSDNLCVIYEDDMESVLGSLIRGRVQSGRVPKRQVTTNGRGDTVNSIKNAICGQCRIWMEDFDERLERRI